MLPRGIFGVLCSPHRKGALSVHKKPPRSGRRQEKSRVAVPWRGDKEAPGFTDQIVALRETSGAEDMLQTRDFSHRGACDKSLERE
jgi:hypothetical protein